ncbi:MAG: GTPase/DUF3482 domain-containing protein [Marinobacter sp.]|nr:GTPase/DUF3482 domain-containing protein [Marinobacter sp.]
MTETPVFAVVGHPNKGKSSVVATLSQNDAIAIALEPGTTRRRQTYPLSVDGEVLYELVDTPGFQRPRRVLAWLEAHSLSASDHADTVVAFLNQHRDSEVFTDECELLTPLMAGAGIIYVVDGSVPYSPEHEAEMTILRWTGRPSLALINSIGPGDHARTWQAALGQFFQVVRRFDAVRAPFEDHLGLLKAFGQLEPSWEPALERAVHYLAAQREQRQWQSAELIANALADMMAWQERRTVTAVATPVAATDRVAQELREHWYRHQRQREQSLRLAVEHLYQHSRIQRQEAELTWHSEHDLFSERSRRLWGVSRSYLAAAGFGAGALGGVGVDALTLGSSFGAGALIGGLMGAAGSVFYGDRLAQSLWRLGPLKEGLQTIRFGPVQDTQFGYIVLGRAVDHWWSISQRNHAGRDPLDLAPHDSHWLTELARGPRQELQQLLNKARKNKALEPRDRQRLATVIHDVMSAYRAWRLNRD